MLGQIRSARRKTVKESGRFLLRFVARFIGRQSLIGDQPVFDISVFPWTRELEHNWKMVRAELDKILEDHDKLPAFHELSPDQKRISTGDNWKTFVFYVFGDRFEPNCRRCPETSRLLEQVPGLRNAWFSIIAPHYHIPPHRGPTKGVVRVHLALQIPKDGGNCWLRIENSILHWQEGKCIIFDDFFDHEVQNNTDEPRAVLFLDVDRPMRLPGRLVNRALIGGIKHSAYVMDAKKNMARWEQKLQPETNHESVK